MLKLAVTSSTEVKYLAVKKLSYTLPWELSRSNEYRSNGS